jgi:hypothetical protein
MSDTARDGIYTCGTVTAHGGRNGHDDPITLDVDVDAPCEGEPQQFGFWLSADEAVKLAHQLLTLAHEAGAEIAK